MIIMIFMTTTTKQTQHDAVAAADISTWCNTSRTLSARSSCRTCYTHHQCIIERQPVTQNINALWNVIELNEYIQPLNTFLFSHTSYQYMNKILGYVENFQIGMFFMLSFMRRNKEHPILTKFHTAYLWAFSFLSYGVWCIWTILVDGERMKCGLSHKTLTGCKASPVCSLHVLRSPHNRALPSSRFGSQAPHKPEQKELYTCTF